MSKKIKTGLQFLKISEKEFLIQRPDEDPNDYNAKNLSVVINTRPSVNTDEETLALFVSIEYLYASGNKEFTRESATPVMKFSFDSIFQVEGLNDLVTIHDKTDEIGSINKKLLTTVFSISFSMARGILFDRARNTFIEEQGLQLPVINPSAFIENSNIPLESNEQAKDD